MEFLFNFSTQPIYKIHLFVLQIRPTLRRPLPPAPPAHSSSLSTTATTTTHHHLITSPTHAADRSPLLTAFINMSSSGNSSNAGNESCVETTDDLDAGDRHHYVDRLLRDKETKLTDVRLEALATAHQLDQAKEDNAKLRSEMERLRAENVRIHHMLNKQQQQQQTSPLPSSAQQLGVGILDHHRSSHIGSPTSNSSSSSSSSYSTSTSPTTSSSDMMVSMTLPIASLAPLPSPPPPEITSEMQITNAVHEATNSVDSSTLFANEEGGGKRVLVGIYMGDAESPLHQFMIENVIKIPFLPFINDF